MWGSKRRNKTINMGFFKKILLVILIAFVVIQFIRSARNTSGQVLPTDITKTVNIPDTVLNVFNNSCYDCHSDNTRYPWYINIQPIGWVMAGHIRNGKENLNFSEFGTYSERKQANKLKSIKLSIKDGSMPLPSYTMMHTGAKLSIENKNLIIDWATKAKDSIEAKN
jgi:hypothetical protein